MEILGIELTTFLAIVIVLIVLLLIAILATLYEHTEQVCKEFLGMGDEEFVEHMISGAFGY